MTLYEFIYAVSCIADEKPTYRLGGKGADGTCDCIGLIIGACERCGGAWNGTHGSNWAARNVTDGLVRITSDDDLCMGDIVYKAYSPGDTKYSLPSKYDSDPDRRDYYHVGVVTSVKPLEITHCTTGGGVDGIKHDSSRGKWSYRGRLSLLEDEMVTESSGISTTDAALDQGEAIVTAVSGLTVRFREKPSTRARTLQKVPLGTKVNVVGVENGWAKVELVLSGYMMTDYLVQGGGAHG